MSIPFSRGLATIGPYQVLADLGAVPWGTASAAVDTRSDREVVLLVVPPSRRMPDEGEISWEVLLAETAALERFYHPGIPALCEIAGEEGDLLIAFAPGPGRTLAEELAAGRAPDRDGLVDWGCQILDALAEAHGQGLLHRHLSEGEVVVGPGGRLTLTGFGLTQMSFAPSSALAPEVRAGAPATRRSDIYAAGALLRRLARRARLAADDPLYKVLSRAAALDPAARFDSAAQMAEALRQAGRGALDDRTDAAPERLEGVFSPGAGEGDRRSALLLVGATLLLLLSLLTAGWVLLAGHPAQNSRATSTKASRQASTSSIRTYSSSA
jgi:eukaryotic-like serine/threonine-protein kinase